MLILTRKVGTGLLIGDQIRLVVLEIRGKQIRLGIEAPPDVVVLREEIFQNLVQENLQAAAFRYADVERLAGSQGCMALVAALEEPPTPGTITITTRDLGQVTVREEQIITFPAGLPGFAKHHRYVVLELSQPSQILYLQCVDHPLLAFPVMDPGNVIPDYRLRAMSQSALQEMGVTGVEELQILVLLTIPPGQPRETTANLTAPLLINLRQRLGKQIIVESSEFPLRYRILSA